MLNSSCQLLLVLAPDWGSTVGQLQAYERGKPADTWRPLGSAIAVSLGRSGLAWGRGVHALSATPEREKREGDGCSPAGVFAITGLFGDVARDSAFVLGAKLPYFCATKDLKAIDDPASVYYNRIIDQSVVAGPDWVSCEDMLRDDQRYAIGAVVAHNVQPPVAGGGSCIFLHVWAAPEVPTAGCTAMALTDMSRIASWLNAAAQPLLVQLPQAEYEHWREDWSLPVFSDDSFSGR